MSAIASTLANLITETAGLLADPGGSRWAQTIAAAPVPVTNALQWWLNEAQDEFTRLTGIYRATASVAVTAGTPTATIADANGNPPFGPILRLEDQNGKALLKTSAHALDTLAGNWKGSGIGGGTVQGQPDRWIRGLDGFGTVRFYPTPSTAQTFTAYFVARPQMMTAGGNYPFTNQPNLTADNPAHYHYALPYYAAYKALTWNQDSRDLELAKFYFEQFQSITKQAAAEVQAAMDA